MKKAVILIILTGILIIGAKSIAVNKTYDRTQIRKKFEQRLDLSDKQKEKAREIHKKGSNQMKSVIYEMEMKRQEIEKIKGSSLSEQVREEKINKLNEDIKILDQKAKDIRKENSKEFESILNRKQKKELEQMKAEGRARFEKKHPPRPPFGYFNSAGFWEAGRLFRPLPTFLPEENRIRP